MRWGIFYLPGCVTAAACIWANLAPAGEPDRLVGITENIPYTIIKHRGVPVTVQRVQDTESRLSDDFTKTSRPCPPFCIHPMAAAPGVQTIGELELIEFIQNDVEAGTGFFIDARISEWHESETIPGAVNVPFVLLTEPSGKREKIIELFGATRDSTGKLDFTKARTLALFCNGPWCDQSPRAIKSLITYGYPPEKLKYYRGGLQAWKSFGLTTVVPQSNEVK